jgi:hypothetical protein
MPLDAGDGPHRLCVVSATAKLCGAERSCAAPNNCVPDALDKRKATVTSWVRIAVKQTRQTWAQGDPSGKEVVNRKCRPKHLFPVGDVVVTLKARRNKSIQQQPAATVAVIFLGELRSQQVVES